MQLLKLFINVLLIHVIFFSIVSCGENNTKTDDAIYDDGYSDGHRDGYIRGYDNAVADITRDRTVMSGKESISNGYEYLKK